MKNRVRVLVLASLLFIGSLGLALVAMPGPQAGASGIIIICINTPTTSGACFPGPVPTGTATATAPGQAQATVGPPDPTVQPTPISP